MRTVSTFEQGPIRPPSEANSLLVRVSRNCPWNRCAFCSLYKGTRFSLRSVEEVLQDVEAMRDHYGDRADTVFLQDANPLLTRPDDLVQIVTGITERLPSVNRITAYARSHTLARRTVEDLTRIRRAGLDRLHIGFESGCNDVLAMVDKGTTQAEQVLAGQRAKAAGFEISEYWMPGLGGTRLSTSHADESAQALTAIQPHFIRLRTTAVVPGTPLHDMQKDGRFKPLDEVGKVVEIRRFLAGLTGLQTRLESDHMLNLLMSLRGNLPDDLPRLLKTCDDFLARPEDEQQEFISRRRRLATLPIQ
jgi:radical SAM superfamily enzyme YgiQ (UPF0313 family)